MLATDSDYIWLCYDFVFVRPDQWQVVSYELKYPFFKAPGAVSSRCMEKPKIGGDCMECHVCTIPLRAPLPSWSFDNGVCSSFTPFCNRNGRGKGNNFPTKRECEETCGVISKGKGENDDNVSNTVIWNCYSKSYILQGKGGQILILGLGTSRN